jgi:hypothetical protein
MSLIDLKREPTKLELILFAVLLVVFGGIVGALALARPEVLLVIAVVALFAWAASMMWNKDEPRSNQLLGLICPVVFLAAYASAYDGVPEIIVASLCWIAAVAAATGVVASPEFGRRLYHDWMLAFLPMGWAVSQAALAFVYYLVITPMGIAMRMFGRDPLWRKFDPSATTYWIERRPTEKPKRYFQQF